MSPVNGINVVSIGDTLKQELAQFEEHGEPAISFSKIGEGPEGMTLRGPSIEVLDAYQAAK